MAKLARVPITQNKSNKKEDTVAVKTDSDGNPIITNENSETSVTTEIKNKEKNEEQEQSNNSHWLIYLVIPLVIAVLIVLVAIKVKSNMDTTSAEEIKTPLELFLPQLEKFKQEFPEIPQISIQIINYTIISVLDQDDPRSPAAILLLGTGGNGRLTDKILNYLMKLLANSFGMNLLTEKQFINFENEKDADVSELKLSIIPAIKNVFKIRPFIALQNIDKVPWEVVSLLHPYFDHENAPFKKVIYLCTATTDEKLPLPNLKAYRQLAENLFDKAWEKYHSDHRDAMYSRLFTALAVI